MKIIEAENKEIRAYAQVRLAARNSARAFSGAQFFGAHFSDRPTHSARPHLLPSPRRW